MAAWHELVESAPEFADRVADRLNDHVHKTLATLRADGSPRISGIETFIAGGELWFGSMPAARKVADLQRDPRVALHSGSSDPPDWPGDAKLSGIAVEELDAERRLGVFRSQGSDPPDPDAHVFRLDIHEAVLVGLNEARDRLVVELWRPGQQIRRTERA